MVPPEDSLLDAARAGDEDAFHAVVAPHRAELHAHCYRMLASLDDADDALQETLVKAWRGLPKFEGRSSLRTWLFRIATNVGLDAAGRRSRREIPVEVESADGGEVTWLGPYPEYLVRAQESTPEGHYDARESLEIAFIAGLQHLPAQQRAVLILREVLAFSAHEVAEILETTVAAVNSALQRARANLDARRPVRSQEAELYALGSEETRILAGRYARAIEESDVESLLGLVTADITWSMPPDPGWYQGLDAVRAFLTERVLVHRWRHAFTTANGQLAVGGYLLDEASGTYLPIALDVLTLREGKVAAVLAFLRPWAFEDGFSYPERWDLDFTRFGLPAELPA